VAGNILSASHHKL